MRYVLLAGGWYLNASISMSGVFYVADSLAPRDEFSSGCHYYGPAAWDGKDGPVYGRELIVLRPLHWDYWYAATEASLYELGESTGTGEALKVWPARVIVTEAGGAFGMQALDGLTLGSETELIAHVNRFAQRYADRDHQLYDAGGRLKACEDRFAGVLVGARNAAATAHA